MSTLEDLVGPFGTGFAGNRELGVIIIFTDEIAEAKSNSHHLWTGYVVYVEDHYAPFPKPHRRFVISANHPMITEIGWSSGFGESAMVQNIGGTTFMKPLEGGNSVDIVKPFVVRFVSTPTAAGIGSIRINVQNPDEVAYFWVRPIKVGQVSLAARSFEDPWKMPIIKGPARTGMPGDMFIEAPRTRIIVQINAATKLRVLEERTIRTSTKLIVATHFVKANSLLRVGKPVLVQATALLHVGSFRFALALMKLQVGVVKVVNASVTIPIRSHFVRSEVVLRVGGTAQTQAVVLLKVGENRELKAFVAIFVTFITVPQLSQDMQIQFGADLALETEQFEVIPPGAGGNLYSQNLLHALIEAGSESVRKVLSAPNAPVPPNQAVTNLLYGIDYTRGRFIWFGSDSPVIEIAYRRSVSGVTESNMSSSIVKATRFISDLLLPGVDVLNPLFIRGAVELAMAFLMDAAIWNTINAIADFEGQAARINSLQIIKREYERRAYESLAPFIKSFSAGSPVGIVGVRPSAVKRFGETA